MAPLKRAASADHGAPAKVPTLADPGMSTLAALVKVGAMLPEWRQIDCTSPETPASTAASTPLHERDTVPATCREISPARVCVRVGSRIARGEGKGVGKRLVTAGIADSASTAPDAACGPTETVLQDSVGIQSGDMRAAITPMPRVQSMESIPIAQAGKRCRGGSEYTWKVIADFALASGLTHSIADSDGGFNVISSC